MAMKEKNTSQGLLCFGGSFNPIHNGHLLCCREVADRTGFQRVTLVPSAMPPHKAANKDIASATDRLALCRLAAAGDSRLEVSDLEVRREGPSYTIDTVRELKAQGYSDVNWLIGADMLMILPKWHLAGELIREAKFLIMKRPGCEIEWQKLPPEFQHLQASVVEAPLIDISATEIRRRVRAGEDISQMVPPAVERYIREHRLYLQGS